MTALGGTTGMEGASQRFQGWAGRAPGWGPEPQGWVFRWTQNRGVVSVAGQEQQGSKETQLSPLPAACARPLGSAGLQST